MSKFLLHVDLSRRTLITRDGGSFSLPSLTLGDTPVFVLRALDRDSNNTLVEKKLKLRTLRASIGPVLAPPSGGTFTLNYLVGEDVLEQNGVPGQESVPIAFDATAESVRAALVALPENTYYNLAEVRPSTDPGCWLLRFNHSVPVPFEVRTNRLFPRSFVRVRAYQDNGRWWHELRLIQSPFAFSGSHERVLADAPSVRRIRAGSPRVDGSSINTNEVQALTVPTDFEGTYYLQFDYRSSRLIGIEDGPDEIAAALNAMWTDGKTRFVVTNPEVNNAYIEFTGPLEAAPWPLMTISVHTFREGDITFSMDLKTAELASALRGQTSVQLPFEVEAEVVDDEGDLNDPAIPGRIVTLFSAPVTITREQIWEELASVPQIDWLRPPQPKDYIPWTPDQIITGQQHYLGVIGDGASRSFNLDHMLGTSALHVTVRENSGGGRRLRDDEFAVTFDSDNAVVIDFPENQPVPASNSHAVTITAAGPKSAFQDHHHSIGQIDGLEDELNALGLRVTAIENLLPSVNPSARSGTDTGKSLEIEIPDRAEMFPGKFAADFDAASAADDGKNLPKPAGLLPAIHDALLEPIVVPLVPAYSMEGRVCENGTGADVLVPGGLGRRGAYLEPGGFAGSDGRVWYRLARDGSTNSFYPVDFERELFMLHINDQMLRAGTAFSLDFKLALKLFNATTRAQYLLRIDVGSAPGQTVPAPTGENLENVTWVEQPVLSQRIILSGLKITHRFGCAIRRDINGALHADQMAYGHWTAAAVVPPSASFALRARLVEFDTENSVRGAKGTVFFALSEAKAEIQ